jgi:rRNA maturation protein Nop10
MYKKITHQIHEEHFAHPAAVEIKKLVDKHEKYYPALDKKIVIRKYPDGEQINNELPASYKPASSSSLRKCGNCRFYTFFANPVFDTNNNRCSKWNNAKVRADYICDAWDKV